MMRAVVGRKRPLGGWWRWDPIWNSYGHQFLKNPWPVPQLSPGPALCILTGTPPTGEQHQHSAWTSRGFWQTSSRWHHVHKPLAGQRRWSPAQHRALSSQLLPHPHQHGPTRPLLLPPPPLAPFHAKEFPLPLSNRSVMLRNVKPGLDGGEQLDCRKCSA